MYGLVNRSIEDLIVGRYGQPAWEKIVLAAGFTEEVFLSNETYPDALTYRLVGEASRILGVPAPEILEAFGEHWIVQTAEASYGAMLDMGGTSLGEFLTNLPHLHSRVMLLFPKLTPPTFRTADAWDGGITVHYQTSRDGLAPFVVGIIKGLGKRFSTPVTVTQVGWRKDTGDTDSLRVEWSRTAGES